MTTEEVKTFLRGYQRAKESYRQLLERIKVLESILTSISLDYEREKVQSTPVDMATKIAALSDMRSEKIKYAENETRKMEEVCNVIDRIDGTENIILHRRYIEGQRWEEIAVALNYTYRNVTYLHGKALLKVKDILEKERQSFPTFS